jgi:hypothetical protein
VTPNGATHESQSIRQEDLREMQNRAPKGSRAGHLLDPQAQAEAGVTLSAQSSKLQAHSH